jgi:outer membrane protein TolC
MKKNRFLLSFCLILLTYLAKGQSTTQAITLQEAVEAATGKSKLLKIADYKIKASQLKYKETAAGQWATLSLTSRYTRLSNNIQPFAIDFAGSLTPILTPLYTGINVLNTRNNLPLIFPPSTEGGGQALNPQIIDQFYNQLTLQQLIYAGGKVRNGLKIAKLGEEMNKLSYDKDKADVILNVKLAYWNLYKAQQGLEQLNAAETQVNARIKDLENMVKVGMATESDLLKLKVQLYNIQLQKTEIQNTINVANAALNMQLNQDLTIKNDLKSVPNTSQTVKANLPELIEKAYSQRQELKMNELNVKTAEVGEKIAKAGYLPQVVAQVNGYYANPNQRVFPQEAKFKETGDASLVLSWTLWNWNIPKHQAEQYKLQALQAQEFNSFSKDNIALEITQHFLSLQNALARLNLANETVKQAEENYRVTNNRVKQGLSLTSDLVDAEVALLNAKISQVNAAVDYELGLARLERAVGGLE